MKETRKISKEQLAQALMRLPDEGMLDVLEIVFRSKSPYPDEQRYFKNHFFLGIATSSLDESDPKNVTWKDWETIAVSYIDRETYPLGMRGPGFCQFSRCLSCGIKVASSAKGALCSICGTRNSLT